MDIVELKHQDFQPSLIKSQPSVFALGFFDGVHLGHQTLLKIAKEIAQEKQLEFAVMTFYPHPKEVLQTDGNSFPYLTPFSHKKDIFINMGVERLYIVEFEPSFSQLSPQEFIKQYIIGLCCQHVVAGFDFTYGYKGQGTMKQIGQDGKGMFDVTTITKIEKNHQKVGSTIIRQFIKSGQVDILPEYLGDFYEMRGRISRFSPHSKADNRLAFKIDIEKDYVFPKPGVYEVCAYIGNQVFNGKCHQIFEQCENVKYIEVELKNCFENVRGKPIILKWIKRVNDVTERSQFKSVKEERIIGVN